MAEGKVEKSFKEFQSGINTYLNSKIPDVGEATRLEIASYLTSQFMIYWYDHVENYNWELRKGMKKIRHE